MELFWNIVCPILSMMFGLILGRVMKKSEIDHHKEVCRELYDLRNYCQDLISQLEKERETIKGVKEFLNP